MPVTGLENFKLSLESFRRLGNAKARAYVALRTYDLTPAVRKLPPSLRHAYLIARVNRWIASLRRSFPELVIQTSLGKPLGDIRRKSDLPSSLRFSGPARKIVAVAGASGVSTVHIVRVAGLRRQSPRIAELSWYCVRAFVTICVEGATSGMQSTEERFVLLRAHSFDDAKKRLGRKWIEYATPYMNPHGQLVSWKLDRIVDTYDLVETEIDPAGTEVYSKLGRRRMRPEYVWRPKSR